MELSHRQIKDILPHRYPMLLVDTVLESVPGSYIVAVKNVTANEPCYSTPNVGLDPGSQAYPCTLIIESFGQAAGILYTGHRAPGVGGPEGVMLFGSMTGCRFSGQVFPGDTMILRVHLDKELEDVAIFSGEVMVRDRCIATVERMIMAIRPADVLSAAGRG